jgi:deazaflavin-dependent oxidoreductase (nitroreductase family)
MSLIVLVIAAAVVVAVVLVVLTLVYRVLKAAHMKPPPVSSHETNGTSHSHANLSRSGSDHGHSGLEKRVLLVVTATIRLALRLGVRLGPMMMLTVRGRKTGVARTNPIDLFERNGRHWLVATHAENASWVRNLRAAREGTLARGRKRYVFTAVELPQQEAGAVLKEVLGPRLAMPVGGFVLRQTLGVPADAPLEEFVRTAATHPVFELAVHRDTTRGGTPTQDPRRRSADDQLPADHPF